MRPIGLYIHIPYCLHKCGYCDFNSHNVDSDEMGVYVKSLIREIEFYSKEDVRRVKTIFFGGGTPTTLPPDLLLKILESIHSRFDVQPDCEITLEANPATIDEKVLRGLRSGGFNRISIGIQSFDEKELELLERVHSVDEVHLTIDRAREAGFDNLSLDLMFSIPGQTLDGWKKNLELALSKQPEHISTYNLTIEPETVFHKLHEKGKLKMPPEDTQLEQFKSAIQTITDSGYRHYEISNFCKPGKECQHNINYWENGDYLGLGAGASSFLNGWRSKNWNLPARYIREVQAEGSAVETREQPDKLTALGETFMLGLRLLDNGIDLGQIEKRFKVSIQKTYGKVIDSLLDKNLISINKERMSLSKKGLFLADSVILEFIP